MTADKPDLTKATGRPWRHERTSSISSVIVLTPDSLDLDSRDDIEYVAKRIAALPETEKHDPRRLARCARDALRDYEFEMMVRDMETSDA